MVIAGPVLTAASRAKPPSRVPTRLEQEVDRLVHSSQENADYDAALYRRELLTKGAERAVIGGALGGVLISGAYQMPIWMGPLFGAGVGVYTAWESLHRERTGTVTVTVDGQSTTRKFVGDPARVALTSDEARFQALSRGSVSGPVIGPAKPGAAPGAKAGQQAGAAPTAKADRQAAEAADLTAWQPQAKALRELSEQRRLVADLGQTGSDGKSALHLVDGITAASLAAQGGEVFVVNADEPHDVRHQMNMTGFNVAHTKGHSETFAYLERQVGYTLTPLRQPADLENVQESHGVPEGMFGLPKQGTHHTEILSDGHHLSRGESYSPEFGTAPSRHSDRESWSRHERGAGPAIAGQNGIVTRQHVNFPGLLGLMGTAAGLMTAMAFTGPGVPGPAAMCAVVGFLAGRATGRAIIEHTR